MGTPGGELRLKRHKPGCPGYAAQGVPWQGGGSRASVRARRSLSSLNRGRPGGIAETKVGCQRGGGLRRWTKQVQESGRYRLPVTAMKGAT